MSYRNLIISATAIIISGIVGGLIGMIAIWIGKK